MRDMRGLSGSRAVHVRDPVLANEDTGAAWQRDDVPLNPLHRIQAAAMTTAPEVTPPLKRGRDP